MDKKRRIVLLTIFISIIVLIGILIFKFNNKKFESNNYNIESVEESIESTNIQNYFPITANVMADYSGTSTKSLTGTDILENAELILFDNAEFVLIYEGDTKLTKIGNYTSNSDKIVLNVLYNANNDCNAKKVDKIENIELYKNLDESIFIKGNFTDDIIKTIKTDNPEAISKDKYSCLVENPLVFTVQEQKR